MTEEMEVGWLRLSDESDLVLTNLHVFQRHDRGIFGESQVVIPRKAITSVLISWRRSRGLVVLGTILVLIWLGLMISRAGASFTTFFLGGVFNSVRLPFRRDLSMGSLLVLQTA
jgi:hypothetical protein